jgi:hypothetical protein
MTPLRSWILSAVACCGLVSSGLACGNSQSSSPDGSADRTSGDVTAEASGRDAVADGPSDAGPPSLIALRVSGAGPSDASPPVFLVPEFSPDVHDYYVRCVAGTNALEVSMTAAPSSESSLIQPTHSGSSPMQTVKVSAHENDAIVAAATRGTDQVEYWVRCLPSDFPRLTWVKHPEAGVPNPGYYLVGTYSPPIGYSSYAIILDGNGVPVWYPAASPDSGGGVTDVDSLADGQVSYFPRIGDPTTATFTIEQLSPLTTSHIGPTGMITDEHELRLDLKNGDYLAISSPQESGVDLTGLQVPLPDGGVDSLTGPQVIVACNIVEFQPNGTPVWSWSADDHFDIVADSVSPIFQFTGSPVVDPYHCNSIDIDPANGNLLVSARQMNSIFYIEKLTGRVLWKMGGATYGKDNPTYVSVADPFFGQHDARLQSGWTPTCTGGSGPISVFDDQTYGPGPARAVVYEVVVGSTDGGTSGCDSGSAEGGSADAGPPGTATVSWQRKGSMISGGVGSFRISADGSRVIGWGVTTGTPRLTFTEVDINGNDLLDFYFGLDNSYRSIKVPTSTFELTVLRQTAGLPP